MLDSEYERLKTSLWGTRLLKGKKLASMDEDVNNIESTPFPACNAPTEFVKDDIDVKPVLQRNVSIDPQLEDLRAQTISAKDDSHRDVDPTMVKRIRPPRTARSTRASSSKRTSSAGRRGQEAKDLQASAYGHAVSSLLRSRSRERIRSERESLELRRSWCRGNGRVNDSGMFVLIRVYKYTYIYIIIYIYIMYTLYIHYIYMTCMNMHAALCGLISQ
jgi:hypothetical protein